MVSDEGFKAWQNASSRVLSLGWPRLVDPARVPHFVREHSRGMESGEFSLCYAFDVYRRGWQYAERVRGLQNRSAYVPHSLRENCLENTAKWAAVEFRQDTLWSWGKYICAVLRDDDLSAFRTAEAVAGMVGRIKATIAQPHGRAPTWDGSGAIGADGQLADRKFIEHLQEWVVWIAREADLPLLRRSDPVSGSLSTGTSVAVGEVLARLEQSAGVTILLPFALAKILARVVVPHEVALVDTWAEAKYRKVQKVLLRASFDYDSLVPSPLG
jgi:hypothetical protein